MRRLLFLLPLLILPAIALAVAWSFENETTRKIEIRFSRFDTEVITTKAGEPLRLVLQNNDPIEHEWIVGTEATHQRHRLGIEAAHEEIPTEVTIPAFTTKTTTVSFDKPGQYTFVCHLPGHEAYGMSGTIIVLPN